MPPSNRPPPSKRKVIALALLAIFAVATAAQGQAPALGATTTISSGGVSAPASTWTTSTAGTMTTTTGIVTGNLYAPTTRVNTSLTVATGGAQYVGSTDSAKLWYDSGNDRIALQAESGVASYYIDPSVLANTTIGGRAIAFQTESPRDTKVLIDPTWSATMTLDTPGSRPTLIVHGTSSPGTANAMEIYNDADGSRTFTFAPAGGLYMRGHLEVAGAEESTVWYPNMVYSRADINSQDRTVIIQRNGEQAGPLLEFLENHIDNGEHAPILGGFNPNGTYYATDGYETFVRGPQNTDVAATTGGTLTAGTYYYIVVAYNAAGQASGYGGHVKVNVTAPNNAVSLTWDAVANASYYRVYGRGYGLADDKAQYWQVNAPTVTYTDTGAAGTALAMPITPEWTATELHSDRVIYKNPAGTLPTCDSTTRGTTMVTHGTTGVADILHMCMKSAADSYSWKAIVTG